MKSQPENNRNNFNSIVDDVRCATEIVELVQECGIKLKKSGKLFKGLCPFHQEKTPSFTVYPETESWYCFGCGRGGDIFNFTEQIKKINFSEAVRYLSSRAGIKLPTWTPANEEEQKEIRLKDEILTVTAQFYFEKITQDVKDYLIIERCLTEETINLYKIGYAPDREIGKSDSRLLNFLKERGYTKRQAIKAGVVYKDGREYFAGNIIFPNWHYGKVVNLIGRGFPNKTYKNLPKEKAPIIHLFLERKLSGQKVIITEGPPDTYTLRQAGFNAIGILGTSGFKKEWIQKFKKLDTVYIALDGDRPGIEASPKIVEMLGDKARIVTFPDFIDKSGKKAKDWNDLFVMKYKGNINEFREEFQQLLDRAQTLLEFQIKQVPDDINKHEISLVVKSFVPRLSNLSEVERDYYIDVFIDHFKDKLKISKQSLKNDIKGFHRDLPVAKEKVEAIIGDDIARISPALDFVDGIGYVCVPLDIKIMSEIKGKQVVKITKVPYLITSERKFMELNEMDIFEKNNLIIKSSPSFLDSNRWSVKGVEKYLDGFIPDPFIVFQEVKTIYEKYIDFNEFEIAEVLTVWSIGTYLFPIFESFPYVFLNGDKGSGKSKTLSIAAYLCFNAISSSSISTALLFRIIEACSPTILIDEAESLKDPSRGQDLRSVLNSGYKRGGKVYRVKPDTFEPQSFEVFSPKMIANIKGLEKVLENRCIKFTMVRTADAVRANLNVGESSESWKYIRHQLYTFALTYFEDIKVLYSSDPEIRNIQEISGREAELWFPLLAIAKFIDNNGCEGLFDRIKNLAIENAQESRSEDLDDYTHALLTILRDFPECNEISNKQIEKSMKDCLETEHIPSNRWIGNALKKLGIVEESIRTKSGYKYKIKQNILQNLIERYDI